MPRGNANIVLDGSSTVGDRLKQVRLAFYPSISQQQLADLVGISMSYISKIERGNKNPGYKFQNALARIPGININFVVTGEGEPFPNGVPKIIKNDRMEIVNIIPPERVPDYEKRLEEQNHIRFGRDIVERTGYFPDYADLEAEIMDRIREIFGEDIETPYEGKVDYETLLKADRFFTRMRERFSNLRAVSNFALKIVEEDSRKTKEST